jgi:Fur family ferric uptake transcriptional regulator
LKLSERQKFQDFALAKGLKSTKQRDIILNCFLSTEQHMSTEELYLKLKEKSTGIGFATVYRTLKLFSESGIAREIQFGDGQTRYEHLHAGEHHDHLVCTRCGAIVEFENETIEKLQAEVASQHGFTIVNHKLELYGLCAKCKS